MSTSNHPPVTVCLPENRRPVRAFGDEMWLQLDGSQTGGGLTLWENITPPGGGPPPHYHENEDETFLVLEGKASFYNGQTWTEISAGGVVYAPRQSIHTFRNVGETPLRLQISAMPSGFERFFTECAQHFGGQGAPDMAKIVEISARYGIYYVL